ncbi:substrate-binding periplasmic protein [Aquipseudomonas alcaligenes]|uniref:Transporter substrate-binding domain-containing protein n=1 Tax=Aquipseudomonas alcaligenes TaxID=43263 RepID=A0AA42N0A1_AQUAC|nr:transporter substrate-binding domain-containing protein [Pseudomonas alcaligenes]MDH1054755.1 transporter substrate-binding domain-containing protein [Pseudomonas alcaligenes]
MPHPALACALRAPRPVALLRPVLLWLCCAGAWAEPAAEPLRVVTDYWPPFRMEGRDGRIEGLDIDLLEELQRRTGVQFEVRRQPWARALEDMRRGQADLMTGLARTAEREQYIDYLLPAYHACAPRLYGSPQRAASIRDYAQLTGLRIGYVLQSAYFEPFDSDPALTKIGVKNEEQLLQMQLRGRIEVLIGTDCQVDFQLRDPQLAYQPPQQTLLFIGLSRASPRLAERERLSAALQALLREGWLERAAQRYR